MNTSEIEAKIGEKTRRRAELTAQQRGLESTLKAERAELGRSITAGADVDGTNTRIRDLSEEIGGIEQAIPMLTADIESLKEQRAKAEIDELRSEEGAALGEVEAAVSTIDTLIRDFCRDDLALRLEELDGARTRANQAHYKLQQLGARSQAKTRPEQFSRPLMSLLGIIGELDSFAKCSAPVAVTSGTHRSKEFDGAADIKEKSALVKMGID